MRSAAGWFIRIRLVCSICRRHEDCNGYFGMYYGGVFCDAGHVGEARVCLRNCGDGLDDVCPAGEVCVSRPESIFRPCLYQCRPPGG